MKALFRAPILMGVVCAVAGPAMAAGPTTGSRVAAPGPEIGDGAVGIAVASVALLALVLYPRFKRWRQS
jgi:hypothetical protein